MRISVFCVLLYSTACDLNPCDDLWSRWSALETNCDPGDACSLVGVTVAACDGRPGVQGKAVNAAVADDAAAILAELEAHRCEPLPLPADYPGLENPRCEDGVCVADYSCACLCQLP